MLRRVASLALIFVLQAVAVTPPAGAQTADVHARWYRLQGDSILVEYALPTVDAVRPAVIVLSDRFGAQENVRAVLKVLARLGYRAYAPPLRSAPLAAVEGMPDVSLDSSDAEMLTQIAVDIINEKGCSGHVGLLGFDIGAAVAADVVSRFPFFSAAALFYPTDGPATLEKPLGSDVTLQLHLAQYDTDCTLSDVNALRERFMEQRLQLRVFYYKEAHRFFFNPQHAQYHRENTQEAWTRLNAFFRGAL